MLLDLALVVAVLYHALNGVRIILMDFGIGIHRHKIMFWIGHGGGGHLLRRLRLGGLHLHRHRQGGDELKAETVSTHRGGMWSWLFQRITAVLLIVCLAIHLIFTHIAQHRRTRTTTTSATVWPTAGCTAVDIILLAAGIYHALNGLRMVLMDYWFTSRKRALALTIVLWVVGLAFLVYGIWALWPWIG